MIYEVYLDDEILYYSGDEKYTITDAVLDEEINCAATFEFDIPSTNPRYNDFVLGGSLIRIDKDKETRFFGRVTEIESTLEFKKHIYVRGIVGDMFGFVHSVTPAIPGDMASLVFHNDYINNPGILGPKRNFKFRLNFNPKITGIYYYFFKYDYLSKKWKRTAHLQSSNEFIVDSALFGICVFNNTAGSSAFWDDNDYWKVETWEFTNDPTNVGWDDWGEEVNGGTFGTNPAFFSSNYYPAYDNPFYFWMVPNKRITFGTYEGLDVNGSIQSFGKDAYTLARQEYCSRHKKYLKFAKGVTSLYTDGDYYRIDGVSANNYGKVSNQPVEMGLNLISFKSTESFENVITALVSKGTNADTGEEFTLDSARTDQYHFHSYDQFIIHPEAAAQYGVIYGYAEFDNLINQEDLLTKSETWLKERTKPSLKVEATALDLSYVYPNYDEFILGDFAIIKAAKFGLEDLKVMITGKKTYLNDYSKNMITLGTTMRMSFTSQISDTFSNNNILK